MEGGGGGALYKADHLMALMEERRNGQKNQDDVNDAKLKKLVADLDGTNCCLILCAKKYIGDWLNVPYNMVTWKRLAAK